MKIKSTCAVCKTLHLKSMHLKFKYLSTPDCILANCKGLLTQSILYPKAVRYKSILSRFCNKQAKYIWSYLILDHSEKQINILKQ